MLCQRVRVGHGTRRPFWMCLISQIIINLIHWMSQLKVVKAFHNIKRVQGKEKDTKFEIEIKLSERAQFSSEVKGTVPKTFTSINCLVRIASQRAQIPRKWLSVGENPEAVQKNFSTQEFRVSLYVAGTFSKAEKSVNLLLIF